MNWGVKYFLMFMIFISTLAFSQGFNLMLPDGRPSAPYPNLNDFNSDLTASGVGSEYTVPVSRHHIIPYNLIRDFYNRIMANRRRQIIIGGFFRNVGVNIAWFAYQQDVNCNHPGVFYSLELASELSLMIASGQTSHNPGSILRPEGFDELAEIYTWLPGNLFIGPNQRADDPGENFEENARYIVGEERFQILSNIRYQMEAYLHLAALPESATLPYLRRISVLLTQLSKRSRVQPLSASQWRRRGDGKYEIVKYFNVSSSKEVNPIESPWAKRCLRITPRHIDAILSAIKNHEDFPERKH